MHVEKFYVFLQISHIAVTSKSLHSLQMDAKEIAYEVMRTFWQSN